MAASIAACPTAVTCHYNLQEERMICNFTMIVIYKKILTGRSMRIPMGTADARSVIVRRSACFSFSASSSPVRALLINTVAATVSIAKS